MEPLSIKDFSSESKQLLLKELGYDTRDSQIIDGNGKIVRDRYTDKKVDINKMVIFPGSEIILNDSPLSIAAYIQEYGDVL